MPMNPEVMRWPASKRLVAGYALAFGLLVVNTIVTFWNLETIASDSRHVSQTHEVLVGLETVLSNLRDAETGQRGYLLTGDNRYLDPYTDARSEVRQSIADLKTIAVNNGIRQEHITRIEQATVAKFDELEKTIALRREKGFEAAVAIVKTGRGMALMNELRDRIGAMADAENATRNHRRAGFRAAITRTIFTFSFVSALALTLLFAVHFLNQRRSAQLRTSARWLSTTLASIGDAVIATDEAGRVSFMNPAAELLTGWTQTEAQGKPLAEIFRIANEQTGEPIESPVAKVLREGVVVGLANHTVLVTKGNTRRPIDDTAAPIKDDEEKIQGVVLVFHDVTQQRESEREREQLNHELQEKDKRKDEFLAMLAHELRNPLAAIGNAITLSTVSGLQEHIDWSMEVINRQIRHLTRLIDDLLDVSRITRSKIELRRHVLDATAVLDSAIETARPFIEERRHQLEVSIERGNLWLEADPTRLEQVVVNLLHNAAKYSENGGRIRLVAGREGDKVVITLRDFGIGMPPGKLPEMFELFAQGDRSLARSEGGLGIGLTVVKKLVEMHGGSVAARSEGLGQGCEFTLRFPAAKRPAGARPAPEGRQEPPTRRSSRILVVDDNVDTAMGMTRLLMLLGHQVRTVHNGAEAIRVAREQSPEFVLLDIGLPEMDGYEVARRLRQEESCRHAVIVAVSGYGQEEDHVRGRLVGFDHHLVKPVDHNALLMILSGN
jgi:PAS domain S-box-containing protein